MLLLDLWFSHISRLLDVIITLTYDRILDGVYAINNLWIFYIFHVFELSIFMFLNYRFWKHYTNIMFLIDVKPVKSDMSIG